MKVKLAFYPTRFRIPQVCSKCAKNSPSGYDEVKVIENTDWSGKRWRTWTLKFPYCYSCLENLKKKRLFKGKAKAVDVSVVETKKFGGFLKKKKLQYVTIEFKNDRYGQLFKQTNKDILFDKVFSELKSAS